jgi:hypothetical protein
VKWVGHVVCVGRGNSAYRRNLEEGDLGIDNVILVRITLKSMLRK